MTNSVFDAAAFTARLFFPFEDDRPAPSGAQDIMVPVSRDVRLHVRVHPARTPRVAAVLFHGNGELVADYDVFAPRYQQADTTLAVVDFRGYGRSEGFPSYRSVVADAPKVVEELRPILRSEAGPLPIVVVGRSLGSACAAEVARRAPVGVSGLVIESGFGDLEAFVARRNMRTDGPLSEQDQEAFCPLRKLRQSMLPLLLIHGAQDQLIDPREARLLFSAAATQEKQLVYIEGHGHNDVMQASAYWRALTDFLRARAVAP
jgi:alpha-beta hydrolase superfamily lysophospholipase